MSFTMGNSGVYMEKDGFWLCVGGADADVSIDYMSSNPQLLLCRSTMHEIVTHI